MIMIPNIMPVDGVNTYPDFVSQKSVHYDHQTMKIEPVPIG